MSMSGKCFSSSRSIGSRLFDCDLRKCMQEIKKIKANENKKRGDVTILTFLHYYIFTMKTHSKPTHKTIYVIFTKQINSTN